MGSFCYKTANIWQLVGYAVLIIKIIVPILIIILGVIDLSKAVISSDEKAIKMSATSAVKRVILGIVIFFIPSLVSYAFSLIAGFESLNGDYTNCVQCIMSPNGKCDTSYSGEVFKL